MRKISVHPKKSFALEQQEQIRFLLDELNELDLSSQDWKEIYVALLERLAELHDPYEVLAVIYRAVSLRSDYTVASKVIGKFLRNFYLIFEKLPGRVSYFIPSAAGRLLFESLINPLERQEVRVKVEEHIAVVQQLSLISFMTTSRRGVRV